MVFVSNNGFTQKQTKKNNVIIHLLGTGHFDNGRHSRHFVWLSKSLPSNYPTLAPQNLLEMGGLSVYCPYFADEESEAPREEMIHGRPGGPTENAGVGVGCLTPGRCRTPWCCMLGAFCALQLFQGSTGECVEAPSSFKRSWLSLEP